MIIAQQKKSWSELYRCRIKTIWICQEKLPQICVRVICKLLLAIEELKCVCCLTSQDENLVSWIELKTEAEAASTENALVAPHWENSKAVELVIQKAEDELPFSFFIEDIQTFNAVLVTAAEHK